jgi:hypothetical protein
LANWILVQMETTEIELQSISTKEHVFSKLFTKCDIYEWINLLGA